MNAKIPTKEEFTNFVARNTAVSKLLEILAMDSELKHYLSENTEELEKIYELINKIKTDQKKIMVAEFEKYTEG